MYSHGFRPSVLDDLCRSGRIKGGFKIANPALKPDILTILKLALISHLLKNPPVCFSLLLKGQRFSVLRKQWTNNRYGFGERPIFIRENISEVEIYGVLKQEFRFDILPELQRIY